LSEKPKAIISAMGPTSFFLLSPIDPIFFSKKMDDAETHFGAVDYTLWGVGCLAHLEPVTGTNRTQSVEWAAPKCASVPPNTF